MSAMQSMALAIEVATRRRDQAEQALVQARRAVQFAQDQLGQLQSYAADSQARWSTVAAVSVRVELIQHHYQFMDRLQQAIQMQNGVIADLQRKAEATRQVCVQEEVRLAGLSQVMKKKVAERSRMQSRREQKQMDEFAGLKHARVASAGGSALTGDKYEH